jgi:hypothetical protein
MALVYMDPGREKNWSLRISEGVYATNYRENQLIEVIIK